MLLPSDWRKYWPLLHIKKQQTHAITNITPEHVVLHTHQPIFCILLVFFGSFHGWVIHYWLKGSIRRERWGHTLWSKKYERNFSASLKVWKRIIIIKTITILLAEFLWIKHNRLCWFSELDKDTQHVHWKTWKWKNGSAQKKINHSALRLWRRSILHSHSGPAMEQKFTSNISFFASVSLTFWVLDTDFQFNFSKNQ